jgi:hypothetical protein
VRTYPTRSRAAACRNNAGMGASSPRTIHT